MIAALLTALFIFSGVFAVLTIVGSWRQHGAAAMAIRQRLHQTQPLREVRVKTRLVEVHPVATILRPNFTVPRQAPSAALPVAA